MPVAAGLIEIAGGVATDCDLIVALTCRRQAVARGARRSSPIWMVGWPSEVNTARSVMPCTVASTD